jgi:hypothetical protein
MNAVKHTGGVKEFYYKNNENLQHTVISKEFLESYKKNLALEKQIEERIKENSCFCDLIRENTKCIICYERLRNKKSSLVSRLLGVQK